MAVEPPGAGTGAGDEAEASAAVNPTRRSFLRAVALGTTGIAAGVPLAMRVTAKAESPAGASTASPVAQWAMVIDLSRCDGCGLCTKACQKTHVTGDQEWIKVYEIEGDDGTITHLPRPCMHCENAPCVQVCPVAASYHDPHGNVLVDHDRCIGCRLCMAACPYGARSFNWKQPENPPTATFARYSPEYPVPHRKGTVEKCMFCAHNTESGKLPECVTACPMNAIWFGDRARNLATNGIQTMSLSMLISSRNGYRLKEDLGTRPRVWYLPGHGEDFSKVPPL